MHSISSYCENKCGKLSSKSNFHPIGLSFVCSKLLEHIIVERLELYVATSDNQFGFKQVIQLTCVFSYCKKLCSTTDLSQGSGIFVTFWMPQKFLIMLIMEYSSTLSLNVMYHCIYCKYSIPGIPTIFLLNGVLQYLNVSQQLME